MFFSSPNLLGVFSLLPSSQITSQIKMLKIPRDREKHVRTTQGGKKIAVHPVVFFFLTKISPIFFSFLFGDEKSHLLRKTRADQNNSLEWKSKGSVEYIRPSCHIHIAIHWEGPYACRVGMPYFFLVSSSERHSQGKREREIGKFFFFSSFSFVTDGSNQLIASLSVLLTISCWRQENDQVVSSLFFLPKPRSFILTLLPLFRGLRRRKKIQQSMSTDRPTENKIDGSLFGISFCCSSQRQQGEMSISSSSSTIEKSLQKQK